MLQGRDLNLSLRQSSIRYQCRLWSCLVLVAGTTLAGQTPSEPWPSPAPTSDPAHELLARANQERAEAGAGPLEWDPALADAAMKHCVRMSTEGPLAHRYDGEPDLTSRAAAAGAHFSAIEANIAVGATPVAIQKGWLNSPEHKQNLLNPAVDRVGVAVVARQGLLFAVADYARGVPVLTQAEVEAAFAQLLRARNLTIWPEGSEARTYCASSGRYYGNNPPRLLMRWQNPDVTRLPDELIEALANGSYHTAVVGSCPAQDVNGAFTVYRVAAFLY